MDRLMMMLTILFKSMIPLMLEGACGIGKTSVFYQMYMAIRKQLGQSKENETKVMSTRDGRAMALYADVGRDEFGLWSFSAGNITLEEMIGVPVPQPDGSVRYHRSHSFIPHPDHRGGGILVVDEFNTAAPDVRTALQCLLLEGRYLDYKLPANVWIVTSINPVTADYSGQELPMQLMDRFCLIPYAIEARDVLKHFIRQDFNPSILEFLSVNADKCLNTHQKNSSDPRSRKVNSSRQWENVDLIHKNSTKEEFKDVGLPLLSGCVGDATAALYFSYLQTDKESRIHLDPVQIMREYGATSSYTRTTPKSDWPTAGIRGRVLKIVNADTVRNDILALTLDRIEFELEKVAAQIQSRVKGNRVRREDLTDAEIQIAANILVFLSDLPQDIAGIEYISDRLSNKENKNMSFDMLFSVMVGDTVSTSYVKSYTSIIKEVQ